MSRALRVAGLRLAQQEKQFARTWKLGGTRESAPHWVEGLSHVAYGLGQHRVVQYRFPVRRRLLLRQCLSHRRILRQHLAAALVPGAGDVLHQVDEARQLVARRLGKIGAGEERCLVGGEEHRQRPTAAALRQ
jgi:hypothetical protein